MSLYSKIRMSHSSTLLYRNLAGARERTLSASNRRFYHPLASSSSSSFIYPHRRKEEDEVKPVIQYYHATAHSDRAVAIMLGLGALSAASYGAATAVHTFKEFQKERAAAQEETAQEDTKTNAKDSTSTKKEQKEEPQQEAAAGPRENIFEQWFGVGVGSKYYEGGFEDQMTRREAALILGVRESASVTRIKTAHRKLTILNHPDTGGSTYMSGKINEAKELLLKGRKG